MQAALGRLEPTFTLFMCCDIQEAFRHNIYKFPAVVAVAQRLIGAAEILGIPTVVTEQYPKGLKATVPELNIANCKKVREVLAPLPCPPMIITQDLHRTCTVWP